jgi:molybdopterin-guanine dinucleotide biosynthesis protein A
MQEAFDAIVLAGGSARRFGSDKTRARFLGATLIDRVIEACSAARKIIVAGDERPVARQVTWVREHPPGGGPAAGIAAALPEVGTALVAVLAADLPLIAPEDVVTLLDHAEGHDGALFVDRHGRRAPVAAVYATEALSRALTTEVAGRSLVRLVSSLDLAEVPASHRIVDVDVPEDLARLDEQG